MWIRSIVLAVGLSIAATAAAQTITSPGGTLSLTVSLTPAGEPRYTLTHRGTAVIHASALGLVLKDRPSLDRGFSVERVDSSSVDTTWAPVWGESRRIRDRHKELAITLRQPAPQAQRLVVRFRLFDDGLGFRYEFPAQRGLQHFIVTDERTEFALTGDHKAFWIPGDYDTNEYAYNTTLLSQVNGAIGGVANEIHARSPIGESYVQTPLTMKTAGGLYVSIHEAALLDYPAMHLHVDRSTFRLTSHLVPDAVGNKAYLRTPATTPWRTILVSDKATDLLASRVILNLNAPSVIADPSWIRPTKYVGVWWEMHVGKSTWDYAGTQDATPLAPGAERRATGRHGATTARVKVYIDFAARHGFDGVLVEGWNEGWEDWFGQWKENVFDFVTPYPDFDVAELSRYAKAKGVKIIMHHETSGAVTNYERWMDRAYDFMQRYGYDAVKTGYVGRIIPRGEHHDGQWMVNHFTRVAARTAERKIMLDAHESVRLTGLHRTYPNWLAAEAARGNEFNAWSVGNPPEHETILPFTRLLGGPMDYTPGIFQITLDHWEAGKTEQVHTTLAKQLALYVTMYSPLQMAADLPEVYERHLDAFQFIKDVAVDWDESRYVEAEPGDYLTIARKAKGSDAWFIGAITDEAPRTARVPLDFLEPGRRYVATIYADGPDAHWRVKPMAYRITSSLVTSGTALRLSLAAGGGAAVSLRPATAEESRRLQPYRP
ncbi:MAG: glycoside hydrolase family 97 protein [Gemmatimonadaceae bacterium]|nr:glycoside hydrolase family 97 protein [Gemmatimonadaceae bacterium]